MPGRYRLAAFHALSTFALAMAADPADPTITPPAVLPRQGNDAQFIGYIESSGTCRYSYAVSIQYTEYCYRVF